MVNDFLRIYRDLANNKVSKTDVEYMYSTLKNKVHGEPLEKDFDGCDSTRDKAIAIDSVAAKIHKNPEFARKVFGEDVDVDMITKALDGYSGLELKSDIRKVNRGFFTTIKSDEDFEIL